MDYNRCTVPAAREPEVLSAMATIVNKLEGHITSEIPKIFDAVFECTLEMINKDFEEYPEHRTYFFLLLQVCHRVLILCVCFVLNVFKWVRVLAGEWLKI